MRGRGSGGGGDGRGREGGGGVGANERERSGEEGTDDLIECFDLGRPNNRDGVDSGVPVRGGRGDGSEAEVPDKKLQGKGLGKRVREFNDENMGA